jgi:hypothetical protein
LESDFGRRVGIWNSPGVVNERPGTLGPHEAT